MERNQEYGRIGCADRVLVASLPEPQASRPSVRQWHDAALRYPLRDSVTEAAPAVETAQTGSIHEGTGAASAAIAQGPSHD